MLPEGYQLRVGSGKDRALLVKFMYLTYQELFPNQKDFSHLAKTVEKYFSPDTPLWWVESAVEKQKLPIPVACLWIGNAIDQVKGDRYTYIFLLYVTGEHRCRGIGSALMDLAQDWAKARGDRQIGLQVFSSNQPALNLYHRLGYQTQSLLMVKSLLKERGSPFGEGKRQKAKGKRVD
ncbi:MAG: GNAT family N-acetyltransferase [Xenococcaceae cyanobacterium]